MTMFIADLHIHSKYSRACSKNLDLPNINAWCQLKGIDLVATADFTHPSWFKDLHEQLEESAEGIYKLKEDFIDKHEVYIPESCKRDVQFILSTEISLIYKKNVGRVGDKCRKVHHVILAPNLNVVAKINIELDKIGNINSDGRPIIGMDSKELLKLLLSISPDIQLIPAHVWTPHFAIFGSQSGFDSIEECFDEMSDHICALETGLSSDPPMNWRLSQNDKYVLVSSSDAHSPQKLGREATVFDCEMTYPEILNALRNDHGKIAGTIEFYPEEGKYHADGIRNENLCLEPAETKKMEFISQKTGKKITVGVLHRVNDIADRPMGFKPETARNVWYIIPLTELISEILQVGPASKKVDALYQELLKEVGPEFYILKDAPIEDISAVNQMIGEAIDRMRSGRVIVKPGYDGEYGIITIFQPDELMTKEQMKLF